MSNCAVLFWKGGVAETILQSSRRWRRARMHSGRLFAIVCLEIIRGRWYAALNVMAFSGRRGRGNVGGASMRGVKDNKPLVPTRTGAAPVLAAQRRR